LSIWGEKWGEKEKRDLKRTLKRIKNDQDVQRAFKTLTKNRMFVLGDQNPLKKILV